MEQEEDDNTASAKQNQGNKAKSPKQYLHPLDDDEYELIKLLMKGEFRKPIKERTRKEKSVVIKFWRNKTKFELKEDGKLFFAGKEVNGVRFRALYSIFDRILTL